MLCGTPESDPQPDPDPSGSPDAGTAPLACDVWTSTPTYFDPCQIPEPGPAIALGSETYTLNTDAQTLTGSTSGLVSTVSTTIGQEGGEQMMLISTANFVLGGGGTVRVVGSRPVVIASWSSIDIENGLIEASSFRDGGAGAGSNSIRCASHAASDGVAQPNATDNGGGGGGGGFGAPGGDGGFGGDTQAPAGPGGGAASDFSFLRGGCPGGEGGGDLGAPRGDGGGAIALAAVDEINITGGELRANGAGGVGADEKSGGGGGGSGGMIVLDAPTISLAGGVLAANGGGGGEGADNDTGNSGFDGLAQLIAADGGTGNSGGNGGDGGFRDVPGGGDGGGNQNGGGGGGGGVGVILVTGQVTNTGMVVTPDLTVMQIP